MKAVVFVMVAVILFCIDIKELKVKGFKRDMVVYSTFMILAVAVGIIYYADLVHMSVADILMNMLQIKR